MLMGQKGYKKRKCQTFAEHLLKQDDPTKNRPAQPMN